MKRLVELVVVVDAVRGVSFVPHFDGIGSFQFTDHITPPLYRPTLYSCIAFHILICLVRTIIIEGFRWTDWKINSSIDNKGDWSIDRQTDSLRIFWAFPFIQVLPGCERAPYDTDAYWACFARSYASTNYHPVGTCKMGPRTDPKAVVDHTLR